MAKKFVDPWLKVCERCPLDDCIIPEGGDFVNQKYMACPAWRARKRDGRTATECLENADEYGLLQPIRWEPY